MLLLTSFIMEDIVCFLVMRLFFHAWWQKGLDGLYDGDRHSKGTPFALIMAKTVSTWGQYFKSQLPDFLDYGRYGGLVYTRSSSRDFLCPELSDHGEIAACESVLWIVLGIISGSLVWILLFLYLIIAQQKSSFQCKIPFTLTNKPGPCQLPLKLNPYKIWALKIFTYVGTKIQPGIAFQLYLNFFF